MNYLKQFWDQKWWLSIAAGLLLGLSFPPFPFPFLMVPAFIFLLRVCDLTTSYRETALIGFAGFVTWNVIVTYWLLIATIMAGIPAIVANSILMTIPFSLIKLARERFNQPLLVAFLQASAWVTFEFLHHRWDLAWPWLTLGNGFSNAIPFIQYISVTGVLGISFWVIFSASLIYHVTQQPSRKYMIATAIALVLPLAISLVIFWSYDDEPVDSIEVAVMQPNYDSYLDMAGYSDPYEPLENLLEFTDSVKTDNTDFTLWPENALIGNIELGYPSTMDNLIMQYAEQWDFPVISGASVIRLYEEHEAPDLYRGHYRNKPYNVFNAAVAHYPDKTILHYEKAKLVPFIERFPFVDFLSRFEATGIDWGAIAIFGKGIDRTMFDVNGHRIPALICYDSVYPDWVRKFVLDGADIITVITNDGWWGNSSGHIQHYDYAKLRAIENRRTVIRSANNGLSGAIGPDGRVHVKTEYWTRDGFTYNASVYDTQTFYTRHGDLIGWMSMFTTFGLVIFHFTKRRKF
ncbi:MAG: apolipoprotein N-acyltransferase [Balneolales bacterium]